MEHCDRFIMGGPALLGWLRLHSIIRVRDIRALIVFTKSGSEAVVHSSIIDYVLVFIISHR